MKELRSRLRWLQRWQRLFYFGVAIVLSPILAVDFIAVASLITPMLSRRSGVVTKSADVVMGVVLTGLFLMGFSRMMLSALSPNSADERNALLAKIVELPAQPGERLGAWQVRRLEAGKAELVRKLLPEPWCWLARHTGFLLLIASLVAVASGPYRTGSTNLIALLPSLFITIPSAGALVLAGSTARIVLDRNQITLRLPRFLFPARHLSGEASSALASVKLADGRLHLNVSAQQLKLGFFGDRALLGPIQAVRCVRLLHDALALPPDSGRGTPAELITASVD